jgi:hypothetical protein
MANDLILVSSRPEARETKPQNADELGVELEAMSTIGRALDAIEDVALRQRVLQWAVERWGVDRSRSDAAQPQPGKPLSPLAHDPALSVGSIDDLFGDTATPDRPVAAPKAQAPVPAKKTPVESMLQSLAADFQRLADEWNGA